MSWNPDSHEEERECYRCGTTKENLIVVTDDFAEAGGWSYGSEDIFLCEPCFDREAR